MGKTVRWKTGTMQEKDQFKQNESREVGKDVAVVTVVVTHIFYLLLKSKVKTSYGFQSENPAIREIITLNTSISDRWRALWHCILV